MNSVPQLSALFEKREILELSPEEMMEIDGGTTPVCIFGAYVAIGWSSIQIGRAVYDATHDDGR